MVLKSLVDVWIFDSFIDKNLAQGYAVLLAPPMDSLTLDGGRRWGIEDQATQTGAREGETQESIWRNELL